MGGRYQRLGGMAEGPASCRGEADGGPPACFVNVAPSLVMSSLSRWSVRSIASSLIHRTRLDVQPPVRLVVDMTGSYMGASTLLLPYTICMILSSLKSFLKLNLKLPRLPLVDAWTSFDATKP